MMMMKKHSFMEHEEEDMSHHHHNDMPLHFRLPQVMDIHLLLEATHNTTHRHLHNQHFLPLRVITINLVWQFVIRKQ